MALLTLKFIENKTWNETWCVNRWNKLRKWKNEKIKM